MCLIALAWHTHPRYRLVLAANRDEFHARPTHPLARWDDASDVVGGRDAVHGGSWLALRGARLAAVTNVRRRDVRDGWSRGALVADFVRGDTPIDDAIADLRASADRYALFNLLLHDGEHLRFLSNVEPDRVSTLAPGVHGISNGALDAPWPKTERLMRRMRAWLGSTAAGDASDATIPEIAPLFEALTDARRPLDAQLPDTGVGLEHERFLSPAFIRHAEYGTRASTVVLIADDHAEIVERGFGPEGLFLGERRIRVDFAV